MSQLRQLLIDNRDAILAGWLESVLGTYPEDAIAAFGRQRDRFANPVGHSLRAGTRAIFDGLVSGMADGRIRGALCDIIRIRAVQQFTASQAVGFVILLKDVIRGQLGDAAADAGIRAELLDLDRRIDRLALEAFDVFVECREQLCELRIGEVKRSVSWVVERMNRRDSELEPAAARRERE